MMRLSIILLLAAWAAVLNGCAFTHLGEYARIALLNPYLVGEEYRAFFYSADLFYTFENAQAGRDRQRNAAAWVRELGDKIRTEDVMELLYRTPFTDYVAVVEGRGDTLALASNPAWLAIRQEPALFDYLMWAKAYEVPQREAFYWAAEDEAVADATYYADFHARALRGYRAAAPGSFLAHRYAYQLLLLARYAADEEAMATYFDRHFSGRDDVLSDWARFHYAFQWNDPGRVMVELARAFRRTPEKALAVYQRTPAHFDPADYLSAATTDEERADLYVLAAVKETRPVLNYLRQAYAYFPDHPVLPLLLTREINKLEDWLLSYPLTGYTSDIGERAPDWSDYTTEAAYQIHRDSLRRVNALTDRAYLAEVRAFLATYAPDPAVLGLSAVTLDLFRAQLALLAGDYRAADRLLAGRQPADSLTQRQFLTAGFLTEVLSPRPDASRLVEQLRGLQPYFAEFAPAGQTTAPLSRLAAQTYTTAGDTLTAYFFQLLSDELPVGPGGSPYYGQLGFLDRPLSTELMDRIIAELEQPQRRPVIALLIQREEKRWGEPSPTAYDPASYLANLLRDLAGTLALRRDQSVLAQRYFLALPDSFHWHSHSHGFAEELRAPVVGDSVLLYAKPPYRNKAEITDELIRAERRARRSGAAEDLLVLGDLWYSLSYHGTAWMMLSYYRSNYPPKEPVPWPAAGGEATNAQDYDLFYRASRAEQYYQRARAAAPTTDRELQATIDFRLANLRWRRDRLVLVQDFVFDEARYDSLYQARFEPLDQEYYMTTYRRTLLQQCSWFHDLTDWGQQ